MRGSEAVRGSFWEAQRLARRRTSLYLTLFIILTAAMAVLIEVILWLASGKLEFPWAGIAFLVVTFAVASFQYLRFRSGGGSAVAEGLGGRRVEVGSYVHRLVEEMAIAASLPMPAVYVLDNSEINAFAAGMSPERSAIAVTRGATEKLTRDELQGVIAHELGHIANADTRLNLRLAAMVMGFFFVFFIGIRMTEIGMWSGGGRRGQTQSLVLIAFAFMIAGAITWFLGAALRSSVSRQREYLADASAVQYTRYPEGIANALRKISLDQTRDMPKRGLAFAHMYFSHRSIWGKLFATHPPLEKRIARIEGRELSPPNQDQS